MDLVNLARTSKDLRQVLMSRKSMWVWIVARRNAGAVMVPDPPEDMSEPAWALLLFGPAVCSVRNQSFSCIVWILSPFLVTAMLYEERSPGRLCPSPSLVHHLQEEQVTLTPFVEISTTLIMSFCSLVHSTTIRLRCPDLKESVMDLLPYTKSAMNFSHTPRTCTC
jgi:hypothetical protein